MCLPQNNIAVGECLMQNEIASVKAKQCEKLQWMKLLDSAKEGKTEEKKTGDA